MFTVPCWSFPAPGSHVIFLWRKDLVDIFFRIAFSKKAFFNLALRFSSFQLFSEFLYFFFGYQKPADIGLSLHTLSFVE
jgi:hypothetical protein